MEKTKATYMNALCGGKRQVGKGSLLCLLFLLILTSCGPASIQAGMVRAGGCEEPTSQEAKKERLKLLEKAAQKFIRIMREGTPADLLQMIADTGFDGTEGHDISKAEIKRHFERKDYLYCYFFDSQCIPRATDDKRRWYSFKEVYSRPGAQVTRVHFLGGDVTCYGYALIKWQGEPEFYRKLGATFDFKFDGREWKLRGFFDTIK